MLRLSVKTVFRVTGEASGSIEVGDLSIQNFLFSTCFCIGTYCSDSHTYDSTDFSNSLVIIQEQEEY